MIFDEVKQLCVDEFKCNPDKITAETHFINDLGADSLDALELVMKIEKKYGFKLTDEESMTLLTVGDVVKIIEEKLGK